MIRFRCSHCNKKFGVPDDYAGRRIRCNTCDHHTMVPKLTCGTACGLAAAPGCAANSDSDDDIVLSLFEKDAPAVSDTPAQNTTSDIQLQSFHHYSPSDSVVAGPEPKPEHKNTVSELLKRCRPNPRTDRTELALYTLSYISCIGPLIFIILFIVFLAGLASGINNSIGAIPDPNSTVADPNTVSGPHPLTFLPPSFLARCAFYAFSLGISPLALIASLVLVFRYSYDMPKTLYFSIVFHGLIFFSIFGG